MVQVIKESNPQGKLADMLGMSLGQGLGQGLTTYFANRSLESVLHDKALEGAPVSKKLEAMRSALAPYGEAGQQMLGQRMQIEQQEMQEKGQKIKGQAVGKYLRGENLTPEEESYFTPSEMADLYKARNPKPTENISERPIDSDQLAKIQKVRQTPGYEELDELGQYEALIDGGVSRANAESIAKLRGQQLGRKSETAEKAYKAHKDFIDSVTQSAKAWETETKPKLKQLAQLATDADLIGPGAATTLEALGLPLGILENPSNELFEKTSLDLLKGLPESYGNRILKVEVENFLRTIPTLKNSANGRRMIASNLLKLGEMKEAYYQKMRSLQRQYDEAGKPLPRDFEQEVFDQARPQIDKLNNEFLKISSITNVPPGEVPFFDPSGNVVFIPKNLEKDAIENGGKKIW